MSVPCSRLISSTAAWKNFTSGFPTTTDLQPVEYSSPAAKNPIIRKNHEFMANSKLSLNKIRYYLAVQRNLEKGCVNQNCTHPTSDDVY